MLSISRFSEDKEGILKGLKKRKFDVLDLGCGTGFVGLTVAKNLKVKNNYYLYLFFYNHILSTFKFSHFRKSNIYSY